MRSCGEKKRGPKWEDEARRAGRNAHYVDCNCATSEANWIGLSLPFAPPVRGNRLPTNERRERKKKERKERTNVVTSSFPWFRQRRNRRADTFYRDDNGSSSKLVSRPNASRDTRLRTVSRERREAMVEITGRTSTSTMGNGIRNTEKSKVRSAGEWKVNETDCAT